MAKWKAVKASQPGAESLTVATGFKRVEGVGREFRYISINPQASYIMPQAELEPSNFANIGDRGR